MITYRASSAVTVGGVSVTGQYLAAVTKESSEFQSDPADGLLGLGLPQISNLGHVSIPSFPTIYLT